MPYFDFKPCIPPDPIPPLNTGPVPSAGWMNGFHVFLKFAAFQWGAGCSSWTCLRECLQSRVFSPMERLKAHNLCCQSPKLRSSLLPWAHCVSKCHLTYLCHSVGTGVQESGTGNSEALAMASAPAIMSALRDPTSPHLLSECMVVTDSLLTRGSQVPGMPQFLKTLLVPCFRNTVHICSHFRGWEPSLLCESFRSLGEGDRTLMNSCPRGNLFSHSCWKQLHILHDTFVFRSVYFLPWYYILITTFIPYRILIWFLFYRSFRFTRTWLGESYIFHLQSPLVLIGSICRVY